MVIYDFSLSKDNSDQKLYLVSKTEIQSAIIRQYASTDLKPNGVCANLLFPLSFVVSR